MKLAAFVGCDTARNDPIYGCLPVEAVNIGAQCAVGLGTAVYFESTLNCIGRFTQYFWNEATGRSTLNGVTSVSDAWLNGLEDLMNDVDNPNHHTYGYETKYWAGTPASVFLAPATPRP